MTDRLMSQTQCDLLYFLYHKGESGTRALQRYTGYSTKQVAQAMYGLYCRQLVRQDRHKLWHLSPVCTQIYGIANGRGYGVEEVPL